MRSQRDLQEIQHLAWMVWQVLFRMGHLQNLIQMKISSLLDHLFPLYTCM
ncbi:hypothetical protein Hanom_Chr09g00790541 [Helianthus anomalus]